MKRLMTLAEQSGLPTIPEDRRAVLVTGVRTPFTRIFTEQMNSDTIDLGVAAVDGLIKKTKLDVNLIDHLGWGCVLNQVSASNTAREIIIDLKLPPTISAVTESMACASGMKAILSGVDLIQSNQCNVVIAGGSESLSTTEMVLPRSLQQSLGLMNYGKLSVVGLFKKAGAPCSWVPKPPAVAERSTGKTMGYHADVMSELCGATRKEQEQFAMASHINAAAAVKNGVFSDEIVPVQTPGTVMGPPRLVTRDNLIRAKQNPAKLATLKTVFRKKEQGGTITAATASPLTDGASALLIMSASKAKELGYRADIAVKSWAMSGINPQPNLLLAPALAIPLALKRANLTLNDIDFFEFHEAFAGQVLATIKCLASAELCQKYLNIEGPVGQVDMKKVNLYGGSVSIGHPFGGTGGRIATNCMRLLRQKKEAKYALASICAAGGLGIVTIFEKI